MGQFVGTETFRAPEIQSNKGFDQSSDLWSLGLMIFEVRLPVPIRLRYGYGISSVPFTYQHFLLFFQWFVGSVPDPKDLKNSSDKADREKFIGSAFLSAFGSRRKEAEKWASVAAGFMQDNPTDRMKLEKASKTVEDLKLPPS